MCAFARTLPTDAAKCFNCSGSSLSGCRPAYAHCPSPFAILFSLFSCPCSLVSGLRSTFAFRLHHTPFAIGQPFGSCQIVSCGCHTLRISNAPYAALPLATYAARCTPVACRLPVVGCFVSSVNVCVCDSVCLCVCVCVCFCVCVFNYKMSDKLKIKFTPRLILSILVLNSIHCFLLPSLYSSSIAFAISCLFNFYLNAPQKGVATKALPGKAR